jgi:hypothetical protein
MLVHTVHLLAASVICLVYSIRAISEKALWSLVLILTATPNKNGRLG